jgi:hypothetical protein
MMREIRKLYLNDYAMTNNILQDARDFAKVDLFGRLEDNVKYTYSIAKATKDMGHIVELIFTDRCAKLQTVGSSGVLVVFFVLCFFFADCSIRSAILFLCVSF